MNLKKKNFAHIFVNFEAKNGSKTPECVCWKCVLEFMQFDIHFAMLSFVKNPHSYDQGGIPYKPSTVYGLTVVGVMS